MKPENTLGSPYADLLPASSVEALNKLAQELDDMYTAPQKPAGLSWTNALQYRSLLLSRPKPRLELPAQALPGLLRTKSQLKKSFPALAALIMAVLLGTGLLNPTLWQSLQATPGIATLHSQANALLLSQLLQSGRPTIQQLVQSNQFTVHQTQKVDSYTVTLERVLADANNILVAYTIDGKDSLVIEHPGLPGNWTTVTVAGGHALDLLIEERKASSLSSDNTPGHNHAETSHLPIAALAFFAPDAIRGNPHQVDLQITIPVRKDAAHFHLTVPSTRAKSSISIRLSPGMARVLHLSARSSHHPGLVSTLHRQARC